MSPDLAIHDERGVGVRVSEDKVDEILNLQPDASPIVRSLPLLGYSQTLSAITPSEFSVSTLPFRGIKRGYKNFSSPRSCGVSIHDDPVWLWSLRPKEWSSVFILQSEWERLRLRHPVTWGRFQHLFTVVGPPIESHYQCHQVALWWISGSISYIESLKLPSEVGQVYWIKGQARRWPSSLSDISWRKITHAHVGGTTNARGTFGTRSLPTLDLPKGLQRSLAHVLKCSVRPIACSPELNTPHYTLHDRLSVSLPSKPVLYTTYMSHTGWGQRSLTPNELGACFDLPGFVEWDPRFLVDIAPLQLFRSIIDWVTEIDSPPRPTKCLKGIRNTTSSASADGVWLATINAWLPGSWAAGNISDKAVKSDDARIDTQPWHKRISLVLPCRSRDLSILERLAMQWWRRSIILSFF